MKKEKQIEKKDNQNVKIVMAVITHKPYSMPTDSIYYPIEVGAEGRQEHFFADRDNLGQDNISAKNKYYCELTGLYWAYKNKDYDVLGLVHYRRYFMKNSFCFRKDYKNIISKKQILSLLDKYDFVLPKKRHYFIETNYSHYAHAHKAEALDVTGEVIKEKFPEYYPSFIKRMKKTSGHYFNMVIAKKEVINPYLEWLFTILFEVEKRIDLTQYTGYDQRVFGFISERLLDVYIDKNHLSYHNQKYCFMEKQNWFKKIAGFLKRKMKGNK
jgi:hypothetical protein